MKRYVWLVVYLLLAGRAGGEDPSGFVHTQTGELPIILSAPHGGALDVPNVSPRKGEGLEKGPSGYFTGRDIGTEELAEQVAKTIEKRFGKKPYFVIARSHRKYADFNRPQDVGYEDPDAKPVYDAYHGALDKYCREVQSKFKKGLLLDIHGQGTAKEKVFRGTQNGQTTKLLEQRFGADAVKGDSSLFGRLKARGWTVFPDPLNGKEQSGFTGGHIVKHYGGEGYGIDAVQLEFGGDYRSPEARPKTATTLTEAVVDYSASYLDIPKPAAK